MKNEFIHTVLFFHMCNTRKTLVKEGGKEDKYKYRKKKFIEAQRRNQKDTNRESVTMKNSTPVCTDWWVEKLPFKSCLHPICFLLSFPLGRFEGDLERFVAVLFKLITVHGLNGAGGVVIIAVRHETEAFAGARRQVALRMKEKELKG